MQVFMHAKLDTRTVHFIQFLRSLRSNVIKTNTHYVKNPRSDSVFAVQEPK